MRNIGPVKKGDEVSNAPPSFIKNILSNWGAYGINIIVAFFLSPFVVHNLGDMNYGLWAFIGSVTGYMGLLDMGIRSAVTRYVAEYNAKRDVAGINRLCSTAIAFYIVAGLIAISIGYSVAGFLPSIIKGLDVASEEPRQAVIIVCGEIAFILAFNVFGGIIIGLQRFDISRGISIFVTIIRTVVIVLVLRGGFGIVGLAVASFGSTVFGYALQAVAAFWLVEGLSLSPSFVNRVHLRCLFGFGMTSFIIHIARKIIYYTDSTVIGVFGSASQITYFVIAGNLVEYTGELLSSISVILFPMASDLYARQDHDGVKRALVNGTRLAMAIAIPIYFTFLLMGREFIDLWMGKRFGSASSTVLAILTVGQLMTLTQINTGSILAGMYKHRFIASCMIAEAVANLGLSIVLIRYYGIYGVALGTVIPIFVTNLIIIPRYVSRIIGIGQVEFFKQTFLWAFRNGMVFLVPLFLYARIFPLDSWGRFAFAIFGSLAVYIVFLYSVAITPQERAMLQSYFVKRGKPLAR